MVIRRIPRVAAIGVMGSILLVNQSNAISQTVTPSESKKPVRATAATLGGTDRYLTMVSTDKPIYRAGDIAFVRGVLLNAANGKPIYTAPFYSTVRITGPKGNTVASGHALVKNSVLSYSWGVPQNMDSGEFTAMITYPGFGYAPAERKFDVRAYRNSRLKSQITFLRDGYGPGEKVSAILDVKRAEGGVPKGANVSVSATIDGVEVKGATSTVDENGICQVSFDLPSEISRGEGTLALVIADGGVVETASKTVPILLQTVDLAIYPEGGDLIAGKNNRVYIQATQPNGKPADLVGKVMSKDSGAPKAVAEFKTEHEGRGRFEFIPEPNREYFLTVSEPVGIKTTYPLPLAKTKGAIVRADKDVYGKGQPVTVRTACTDDAYCVTLSKREVEFADYKVDLSNNIRNSGEFQQVKFDVPKDLDGVLTVTVWHKDGTPLAERLVFREQAKPINISITPAKRTYVPGDKTELTVRATDEKGNPVSAVVGVTVTDDTVLEMVDKREQAPRLPVMLFLEPEVQNLADAHVYMDANNPKAPLATDLLLGTQGWRRFATVDMNKFLESNGDKARRVLALKKDDQNYRLNAGSNKQAPLLKDALVLPEEIGRVEGPRDVNLFQVEPTVIDERYFTTGRAERHQKTSPTLPERAPIPDVDGPSGVQRYTFYSGGNGNPYGVVREFAHKVRENRQPNDRVDFAETLYFGPAIQTDAKTGEAKISFDLSDSVTTFRVISDAFCADGSVGASNFGLQSVQPFYTEAKMPLEVTAGDKVLLPINLVNATDEKLSLPTAAITVTGSSHFSDVKNGDTTLGAGQRLRLLQPINISAENIAANLTINSKAGYFHDKIAKSLIVKPNGFPVDITFGGILEPNKTACHVINVPESIAPRSLTSNTLAYPSPLANLTSALESMIRDPHGCFEQTSATSYPLTMAQQYFLTHKVAPEMVQNSRKKLDAGYDRLVGYWCPDRGYEWYGQNPGHTALTAFGLMHFTDMKKVREVDQNMLDTVRAWLMDKRDGQGGFKHTQSHGWAADKASSNAYTVWALLESGQPPATLQKEIDWLQKQCETTDNVYVIALTANSLHLAGNKDEAKKLMNRLAAKQQIDGSLRGVHSSIVGTWGQSALVEGAALATLAWHREPADYQHNVANGIRFLANHCKNGRYGSTQATVLALRSILEYDKQHQEKTAPGKIIVLVDGKQVGEAMSYDGKTEGALTLPDIAKSLSAGVHRVELRMEGGEPTPYSVAVNYSAFKPQSSKDCVLDLDVKLSQTILSEGNSADAFVTVSNHSKEVVPNPVAIVGLPGGMEPRHDQLKELVTKGKIDAYEVRGREVILYWRAIDANAKVELPISLIAAIPGSYTGPASRAYLYYTDEHKNWSNGLKVEIVPKVQIASKASSNIATDSGKSSR